MSKRTGDVRQAENLTDKNLLREVMNADLHMTGDLKNTGKERPSHQDA